MNLIEILINQSNKMKVKFTCRWINSRYLNSEITGLTEKEISFNAGNGGDFSYIAIEDSPNSSSLIKLKKLGKNEMRPECAKKLVEINKNIKEGNHKFVIVFKKDSDDFQVASIKTKKVSFDEAKKEGEDWLKSHPKFKEIIRLVAVN